MVILDHHTHHGGTAGVGAHFHSLDLTGDGSVDRHTQSLIIADLLTHGHRVTLLHEGVAGGADMLGHGDHNDIRLGENLSLLVAGIPLIFFGMDPAEKRKRHIYFTSFKFRGTHRTVRPLFYFIRSHLSTANLSF